MLISPTPVCWTLFYLDGDNEWKQKVVAEVRNLISTYTDARPIHQRLSSIPVSAWEDETPVFEIVIRETLRLIKTGPALRRNPGDNLQFADKTIDKGAYVVYNMADIHLNEMVYSEPLKFDPSRYTPPREEDKQGHSLFLEWGAGRHTCPGTLLYFYSQLSDNVTSGMKIAKLEIKMILALFLSSYEYTLVGGSGMPLKQPLQPDRNDIHQVCQSFVFDYLMRTKVDVVETSRRIMLPSVQENLGIRILRGADVEVLS